MSANLPALLIQGGIPNGLIRSALFSTRSLGSEREHIRSKIASQGGYEISYVGEQLNQYDCQVLYAIFNLQKRSGLCLGAPITVAQNEVIELIGKKPGGSAYDPVYQSLRRLCECSIKITQAVDGNLRTYHGHIVDRFNKDEKGHLAFTLNPDLSTIFGGDCTIVSLKRKVMLTRLLSKWLFDYSSSHSSFIPLTLEYLMEVSGYPNGKSEFSRQLKLSCDEIIEVLGEDSPFIGYDINKGAITLYKHRNKRKSLPTPTQAATTAKRPDADGWINPFA